MDRHRGRVCCLAHNRAAAWSNHLSRPESFLLYCLLQWRQSGSTSYPTAPPHRPFLPTEPRPAPALTKETLSIALSFSCCLLDIFLPSKFNKPCHPVRQKAAFTVRNTQPLSL